MDLCFEKSKCCDHGSVLTFVEMVALLQPLADQMDFKKAARAEYRLDTVLTVESGLQATHIAAARFKVTGLHLKVSADGSPGDSLPVEVTLEAADEAMAEGWVQ